MADYKRFRKDSLSGAGEPPGEPYNAFLGRLLSSILGGVPSGPVDSSWQEENLPGPHAGESDVLQGVVNPFVKAARRPLMEDAAEKISNQRGTLLNAIINNRDNLYHTTYLDNIPYIQNSGLKVSSSANPELYPDGVSLSRVPSIRTKGGHAILVLDKNKVPKTVPVAETGFGKTTDSIKFNNYDRVPNPHFEFEERTVNKKIPPEAIKKIIVRNGAQLENILPGYDPGVPVEHFYDRNITTHDIMGSIRKALLKSFMQPQE